MAERKRSEGKTKEGKIRILFLAANPDGTTKLDLDEEIREIEARLEAAKYRDAFELISKWAVRPRDLQHHLLRYKPHIVHFSGHGSAKSEIILKREDKKSKPVSKKALVGLFKTLKDNVRVVLLNACFSKAQAEGITEVIDCALGMNRAVSDVAAIAFASSFYEGIAFGRSVKEAFELGVNLLELEGIGEETTPALMPREGIDPGRIWLVGHEETEEKPSGGKDEVAYELGASLHNQTPPEENFVGREEELDTITDWYKDPKVRIGALIGWGGVGGNRL